jgi:hypothetical protein
MVQVRERDGHVPWFREVEGRRGRRFLRFHSGGWFHPGVSDTKSAVLIRRVQVSRVKRTLARQREKGDVRSVMDTLAVCVRSDYAGTGNVKIYCEVRLPPHEVG